MFSQKAARRRFSRIFVQKKSTRRHLDFCPPFWIFLQPFIFSKNMSIFFIKIILQNGKNLYSLIFAKFLKIKSQKSAILDCAAILKYFQKLSFQNVSTT
jgi:hypothetical protein